MTGGKDGSVALWNEDFTKNVHTYTVSAERLAANEPRLLDVPPAIRALTVANVSPLYC